MTMTFKVHDKALIEKLGEGKKSSSSSSSSRATRTMSLRARKQVKASAKTVIAVAAVFALVIGLAMTSARAVAAAQDAPRLARLKVDLWPEFDRKAVLVILKGELAPDVRLPAPVSLRIPALSGGPTAVASAASPDGQLFNLAYESVRDSDFITLHLQSAQRLFHIEFYQPIPNDGAQRDYTYVWPGDLAVDRLRVSVKEPAAAKNVKIEPALDETLTDSDGLVYRTADLGSARAGMQIPIRIAYAKSDARTTVEILGKATSQHQDGPATRSTMTAAQPVRDLISGFAPAFGLALALAGAVAWIWMRRQKVSAAVSCRRCGTALAAGSRFCSGCGLPIARAHASKGSRR